ncbi:hypothetical protein MKEN_00962100 [Mycena kentingensis (nom. inval.)]|nr:hypothetical protein MKEN_00962100 [Mycena kentingensis (nom. inval.)]
MAFSRLPTEILDEITTNCDPDVLIALCRLGNAILHALAARSLYREVAFGTLEELERFCAALAARAVLAGYVRSLTVVFDFSDDWVEPEVYDRREDCAQILARCENLRRLSVRDPQFMTDLAQVGEFPRLRELCAPLIDELGEFLVAHPRLRTLGIHGGIDVSEVRDTVLSTLSGAGCAFDQLTTLDAPDWLGLALLRSSPGVINLTIRCTGVFAARERNNALVKTPIPSIQELNCILSSWDDVDVTLLAKVFPSLTKLRFVAEQTRNEYGFDIEPFVENLHASLPTFASLTHLSLTFDVCPLDRDDLEHLLTPRILQLLCPSLEEISISVPDAVEWLRIPTGAIYDYLEFQMDIILGQEPSQSEFQMAMAELGVTI